MSVSNIIEVTFGSSTLVFTSPYYKYNSGMYLLFSDLDLPESYQVHFANSTSETSLEMVGTSDGVLIPDDVWQTGQTIYAWVYLHPTDDSAVTKYEVRIPVSGRADLPDGTEPSESEQTTIDTLVTALNTAVADAEQAKEDAEDARDESATNVTHYPTITDGYWYVWDAETSAYVNTNVKAEGQDGESPLLFWMTPTTFAIPCDSDGNVKTSYSEAVLYGAYKGTEPIACRVVSIGGNAEVIDNFVNRQNATASTPGVIDVNFASGEPVSSQTAKNTITIKLEADDTEFRIRCEVISVLDGAQGDKGDKGDTGDSGLVVTATVVSAPYYSIDYTYADIVQAVSDGKNVVLVYNGKAYPYSGMLYFNNAPIIAFGSFFSYSGTLQSIGFIVTEDSSAMYIASEEAIPDIQINGASITADGVANIPLATSSTNGAMSAEQASHLDTVYADYSSALTALGVI